MTNEILTEFPRNKSNKVDWKATIGKTFDCLYDNEIYKIDIIAYNSKTRQLKIRYNNNIDLINNYQFLKGGVGNVVGKFVTDYRYSIGENILVNGNHLKIVDRFKMIDKNGINRKAYKYKCLNCTNEDMITEEHILCNKGCNVCCSSSSKVLKGYNDLNTTHSKITKYLLNPSDAYIFSAGSNKNILCKCPTCDTERTMTIYHLCNNGFYCAKCSDNVSYPNKFIFSFLSQLDIEFYSEQTFIWSKNKRYDFYLPKLNMIIEANGSQHYVESGIGRTLVEEQENDKLKENLAKENGIENYIVIDCRKSSTNFIKNNIYKSKLNSLFDIKNVDWEECNKYAISNLAEQSIKLWNNGIGVKEIHLKLGLTKTTVSKYLKNGNECGKCVYDAHKEMIKSNTRNSVKVLCIKDNKLFNSILECSKYYGVSRDTIKANKKGLYKLIKEDNDRNG